MDRSSQDPWTRAAVTETITRAGLLRTWCAAGPPGLLRVEDTYAAIYADDTSALAGRPDGYLLTLRTTWLDGQMVTDPGQARALTGRAGLGGPPML